ncbi:MAG TPA: hypothetical protein ENI51_04860 [Candidatus Atribacteria bacterium]|nr:hypothetical protein [Candidatus Atribacteria bacterium]
MDFNIIGNFLSSSAFVSLVLLVTAVIALWQLREISRSRKVTAFLELYKFLQDENFRTARRTLIRLSGKKFKDWSEEEIYEAERACQSYDLAGIMFKHRLIDKALVVDERRDSIIKCWEAAKPMIDEYRKERGKDFWDGFEALYEEAKKLKSR